MIVIIAFAAIALFAMIGLAIDAGRLYVTRAQLSRSVDAAALSGILEFDGTSAGLTNGVNKAYEYFDENEPEDNVTRVAVADGAANEMTMNATKTVDLLFMRVLGIDTATVSAHAKAGFGVQFLDAALVIDSTGSMGDGCNASEDNSGCPIYEAKNAAKAFKNILLGSSPSGNVGVGIAPFRGCYRSTSPDATAPWANSKSNCSSEDSQVTYLTTNSATLGTRIDALNATGGSGTNVCGGTIKGWEILEGTGNHLSEENAIRVLVLLTDGDNNYNGAYTYQQTPYESPHSYQTYACRPPLSCSNVGGDTTTGSNRCVSSVFTPAYDAAEDDFDGSGSNCPSSWNSGSGVWSGAWVPSSSAATTTTSGSPYDTNCHARLNNGATLCRAINLSGLATATLRYYVKESGNWESGDDAMVRVNTSSCTASSGWTTLRTHTGSNLASSYDDYTVDLASYLGSTVYVRFQNSTDSSGEYLYLDHLTLESGSASSSSEGYLNGSDGSNSCGSTVKRERQMDLLTYAAAKAIKADGVEIYVVAFGVCSTNSTTYTSAQCDAQIGNTDSDSTADQRLLKCMASSDPNTNDHYFYASSATELPSIFTTIATQIAHRLIE